MGSKPLVLIQGKKIRKGEIVMSYEKTVTVKRTIWESKCEKCGDSVQKDDHAPRERFCTACGVWVPYKEISYTGPELTQ